jgi:hypothetical protein
MSTEANGAAYALLPENVQTTTLGYGEWNTQTRFDLDGTTHLTGPQEFSRFSLSARVEGELTAKGIAGEVLSPVVAEVAYPTKTATRIARAANAIREWMPSWLYERTSRQVPRVNVYLTEWPEDTQQDDAVFARVPAEFSHRDERTPQRIITHAKLRRFGRAVSGLYDKEKNVIGNAARYAAIAGMAVAGLTAASVVDHLVNAHQDFAISNQFETSAEAEQDPNQALNDYDEGTSTAAASVAENNAAGADGLASLGIVAASFLCLYVAETEFAQKRDKL